MAKFKCLKHLPEDSHHHTCAFPSGYPAIPHLCTEPGCDAPLLVWLNPEEVREYERGERRFWASGDFSVLKVDDRGLDHRDVFAREAPPLGRWGRFVWRSFMQLPLGRGRAIVRRP